MNYRQLISWPRVVILNTYADADAVVGAIAAAVSVLLFYFDTGFSSGLHHTIHFIIKSKGIQNSGIR